MEYINPNAVMLHPGGAGSEQYYALLANPPAHPGALHAPMPQLFALPNQRCTERVPRPVNLSPPQETIPAITFSVNGWPGVNVVELLQGRVTIDFADDPVLEEYGWRSTVFDIAWPGYCNSSHLMRSRIDVCAGGKVITRLGLARAVCSSLYSFCQVVSRRTCPIYPGQESWALTTVSGGKGIRPIDLIFFSLHYYRNAWVPEIYVKRD